VRDPQTTPDPRPRPGNGLSGAPDSGPAGDRWTRALWVAALALALLRFVRLGQWSLWIDEAFTLHDVERAADFANPLGYWLTGAALDLLGRSDEYSLRITSAVLGALCVPLTGWAFRPALGGRASALAALLLACSSWQLYWSQSARFYTLAMALSLLGSGLALRGVALASPMRFVAGIALAAFAAGAHPTAGLVVVALLVSVVLIGRIAAPAPRSIQLVALALAIGGVLAGLGWAVELVGRWGSVKGGGDAAHFVLTSGFYITPALGAAALVGAWSLLAGGRRPVTALVVATPVMLGLVGLALATQVRMTAQYVFVVLPWITALAAAPLERFSRSESGDRSAALTGLGWSALLVLPGLAGCLLYLGPRHGERPRWRDAYAVVAAEAEPGDLVLGMAAPVGEYYLAPGRSEVRALEQVVYLDSFRADVEARWQRHERRTWFVVNREEFEDWPREAREAVEQTLREDCRLVADFPLIVESRDLSVSVFLRP
jgi:hypothetical protein